MSTTNKQIMQPFLGELFSDGKLSVADEIVGGNYLNHNAVPGETPGQEGLKAFVAYLRTAFSDIHFTIADQIAEGDKVVTRWRATGTHQAEFAGIPATGKAVDVTAINIHRISDGQIQEAWLNWDALGMMPQLGVVPRAE